MQNKYNITAEKILLEFQCLINKIEENKKTLSVNEKRIREEIQKEIAEQYPK